MLVGVQRVHDEHVRGCRIVLRGLVVDAFRARLEFFERARQPFRISTDQRAFPVGLVLAVSADRHLHQRGGQGCQDHHCDGAQEPERAVAVAAEEQCEVRQHRDRAGEGGGDGHDQRIAVLHMGELMGHDAGHLALIDHLQKSGCRGDGRVVRAAPGGEGVGLRILDNVHARHRQPVALGEPGDDPVERVVRVAEFLGPVVAQDGATGVPPGKDVGRRRDRERDENAGGTGQKKTADHEDRGHGGEEQRGAEVVRHGCPGLGWCFRHSMWARAARLQSRVRPWQTGTDAPYQAHVRRTWQRTCRCGPAIPRPHSRGSDLNTEIRRKCGGFRGFREKQRGRGSGRRTERNRRPEGPRADPVRRLGTRRPLRRLLTRCA